MIEGLAPHLIRAGLGFAAGLTLGMIARHGRFCTLGAIEDAVYAGDTKRLRAWGLAIAIAMVGTHLLGTFTDFELSRSIYVSSRFEWAGAVVGGLMFGLGMALVGTCGFGTLLRLGGGDLKALWTFLVIAISAYMAMRGVTGLLRVRLLDPLALNLSPSPSQTIGDLMHLSRAGNRLLVAAIAVGLLAFVLADRAFRRARKLIVTGSAIGALVIVGWWITGVLGQDPFEQRRVESFTFVAPLGETLIYAMLASGVPLDFSVGSVLGVVGGAFAAARIAGDFRWEAPDDVRETKRHLLGAFLMGTGGVAALGCTIGQGVTGVSTLSVGSILAIISILIGARSGLYWLVER
ncbi:YeeE/YedE family protein [Microvirga rosea]|uniref:YeeE/YedE family protein n=1 Tax=Microvirga rosea TaxID=2715425 RepID=UPI001D0B090F|nr:YeeE/YedE family protein [Microvirga rosea]MCB8823504.1 YeeE/YedE family protein [Microvirga rosea]